MPKPNEPLAIEVEIRKEKASALRRVAEKLEAQLSELGAIAEKAARAKAEERERLVAAHRTLRAEAEKQRWYLVVQREAMGLSRHDDVDRLHPLPPPLD